MRTFSTTAGIALRWLAAALAAVGGGVRRGDGTTWGMNPHAAGTGATNNVPPGVIGEPTP